MYTKRYHQQAIETGGRVRERLRDGVETALKTLGNGLLAHPANAALRQKLLAGTLTPLAYYRQLLRLVYRLLFLMVAEERGLIPAGIQRPASTEDDPFEVSSVQSFDSSIARLRRLAEQPGVGHDLCDDLWDGLQTTFRLLEGSDGQNPCSLVSLGGHLFGPAAIADLAGQHLRNAGLLHAIRALSLYREKESKRLRRINYGALEVEELGSVYESLLGYRPVIGEGAASFDLVAGTERKTTGSYYTRPELVQELIKSALAPVIEERLNGRAGERVTGSSSTHSPTHPLTSTEKEQALLSIKVCDPACGSGHFLLAAARRLGQELAKVRSGEEQPTPAQFRRAVRDVIQHCIYGVDLNPLAVDLCKLALWIEGHNPGMPLSFLDHHIKQGNALIGATRALMEQGIPDDAYKPLAGDDKQTASAIKKRNKHERVRYLPGARQRTRFDTAAGESDIRLAEELRRLDEMGTDTVAELRAKAACYRQVRASAAAELTRFNLWTAAFFQPLTPANAPHIPTTGTLAGYEQNPHAVQADIISAANRLAVEVGFFHWELEFPQVFEGTNKGFDIVLGNPPWEMIEFEPEEFFAGIAPEIAKAANKAVRDALIVQLRETNAKLYNEYTSITYVLDAQRRFITASNRFPLTSYGRINSYALFAELCHTITDGLGRASILVPIGIATDSFNQFFFGDLGSKKALAQLIGFENEAFIFPSVHHSFKFCALTMTGSGIQTEEVEMAFFCRYFNDVMDDNRRFILRSSDLAIFNPNTRTCPIFRTKIDAGLTRKIYQQAPVLVNEHSSFSPWGFTGMLMFMMNTDSYMFQKVWQEDLLALHEAKMMHQFDHRYATYENASQSQLNAGILPQLSADHKQNPEAAVLPKYWLPKQAVEDRLAGWPNKWLIGFRDITSSVVERTAIFSLLPRAGAGNKIPLVFLTGSPSVRHIACFLSNVNSMPFDFVVRQKIGGNSLNFFIVKQLPVLPPSAFAPADIAFIVPRVVELVYAAWDIKGFAEDVWAEADESLRIELLRRNAECNTGADPALFSPRDGFALPPYRWNNERRALARAELDARIARLYGLTRDELRYILDPHDVYGPDFPGETFRVLKEKEIKQFGEYRTRRLVLEVWDREEKR